MATIPRDRFTSPQTRSCSPCVRRLLRPTDPSRAGSVLTGLTIGIFDRALKSKLRPGPLLGRPGEIPPLPLVVGLRPGGRQVPPPVEIACGLAAGHVHVRGVRLAGVG